MPHQLISPAEIRSQRRFESWRCAPRTRAWRPGSTRDSERVDGLDLVLLERRDEGELLLRALVEQDLEEAVDRDGRIGKAARPKGSAVQGESERRRDVGRVDPEKLALADLQ